MVMDAGNLVDFDSPANLYDRGGIFRNLCDRSNITWDQIAIARFEAQQLLEASP